MHFPKSLAVIPVPALIVIIAILVITLPYRPLVVFEPPLLGLTLSILFRFGMSMVVAYFSGRSYLASGSNSLLLLGSGVLAFGASGLAGSAFGLLIAGPNVLATVNNAGALLASIPHAASAVLVFSGAPSQKVPSYDRLKLNLIIAYLGVLVFTILLTTTSLQGAIPPFFIQGVGPTLLNNGVTGTAMALFAISALLFMRVHSKSKSEILYWYSLALALIAVSMSAFFLSPAPGSAVAWSGRSATCLGGVYFLISVLTAGRGTRTEGIQS